MISTADRLTDRARDRDPAADELANGRHEVGRVEQHQLMDAIGLLEHLHRAPDAGGDRAHDRTGHQRVLLSHASHPAGEARRHPRRLLA
jgi:hypothetical protein